ncbi:hypothetical protein NEOLEDRAFT_1178946 [Neolentinus lepideus HHB14362 ss-1]|uniref:Uncharacterized protein n=1 Tax=Neolentinus lepideus HHB14362 ss-1 TaxID=1314782 RepID=A0A165SA30_9AGAM|nr:hypothetical protein NEOLEDRAFT_1178946 [Neolentinus lepideus HHB14362 ss-1]
MDSAELITDMSNIPSANTGTQASTRLQDALNEPHDFHESMDIPPRSPSRLGLRQSLQSRKEGAASGAGPQRPPLQRRSAELGRHRHGYSPYDSEGEDTLCSSSDSGDEDDHDSDTSDSSAEDDFIYDAFFVVKPSRISITPAPENIPPSPPSPPPPVYQPSPLASHNRQPLDCSQIISRHNYQHHGLSRSSLHYQKWFWHVRHEEWQEWEAQIEEAQASATAYDGIAAQPRPPQRGPPRDRVMVSEAPPPSYSRFHSADPNAPIYPRAGDLSDLRHGQSVHLDRWFCFFPLYKVQKKLFLHDMECRAKDRSSSNPMDSPVDSPVSEDDLTLVGDSSNEIEEDESLDDLIEVDLGGARPRPNCKPNPRRWETNWVLRWEKFAEILRDEAFARTAMLGQSTPMPAGDAIRPAKFYFEEADEDSDGTDSDDDDYGVLMSNPIFTRPLGFSFHSISHDIHSFDARREATLICA